MPAPTSRSDTVQRAVALVHAGQSAQAEAVLRRGLQRSPRDAEAEHLLGLLLLQVGRGEQGEFFLRAAIRDDGRRPEFRSGLGNHLAMSGRHAEAAEVFRGALALDADHAPAHAGLALSLTRVSDFDGALAAAGEAVRCRPGSVEPHVNLSSTLVQAGRAGDAIEVLRDARRRFPDSVPVLTAWLVALNYAPNAPEELLAGEPRRLAPLLNVHPTEPLLNLPAPDRRLRVGYVSGDLRTHSVSFFFEPILECRDRNGFEAWCYSTSRKTDGTTDRLRKLSDGWVDAAELPGEALVDRIRADRIDIIVDLAGHTNSNRVLALARRAAPVQVTYLGYPATTGVPAIDYRVVDSMTDPPGAERFATERLVRLDPCFLCYRAPADAPAVAPLPALSAGHVTFGSFNSMPKVTEPVLDAWASVLRANPGARLVLKNKTLADPNARRRVGEAFGARGVGTQRLDLLSPTPTPREHLAAYARIDIALDTFPYNGTTTTCESLWMGVPVVTMAGRVHAGRVGVSLLGTVGLERFVAQSSVEGYAATASALAGDVASLARLRTGLRERVARSPLCDAQAFAARFEGALRTIWWDWCGGRPA